MTCARTLWWFLWHCRTISIQRKNGRQTVNYSKWSLLKMMIHTVHHEKCEEKTQSGSHSFLIHSLFSLAKTSKASKISLRFRHTAVLHSVHVIANTSVKVKGKKKKKSLVSSLSREEGNICTFPVKIWSIFWNTVLCYSHISRAP